MPGIRIVVLLVSLNILYSYSIAQNWTHFRGNNLDGKALDQTPPIAWSTDSNIVWRTEIPGSGWSSPVIDGNQIWLTTSTDDGHKLYALCIDKTSGEIGKELLLFNPDSVFGKHAVNTYATPTPCIENGLVFIHFGEYGTACLDTASGKVIWERTDLKCEHVQGPGSSPIIYKNLLILHYEGVDRQYIVALDKFTGKTIWLTERPAKLYEPLKEIGKKAYITPIVITVNGRDLLISNGSAVCIAYDINTGTEVWRVVQGEDSTIAMPIYENGLVYFYTSFVSPIQGEKYCELLAVDPSGTGDVSNTNVKWRIKSPILQLLTPIIHNGIIYTVDTKSNFMCIDAISGKILKEEKLHGKFNASPIIAGAFLYFPSTNGKTIVIDTQNNSNIVSTNQLDGQIWATPAMDNDKLFIRTSQYLYKIGVN